MPPTGTTPSHFEPAPNKKRVGLTLLVAGLLFIIGVLLYAYVAHASNGWTIRQAQHNRWLWVAPFVPLALSSFVTADRFLSVGGRNVMLLGLLVLTLWSYVAAVALYLFVLTPFAF